MLVSIHPKGGAQEPRQAGCLPRWKKPPTRSGAWKRRPPPRSCACSERLAKWDAPCPPSPRSSCKSRKPLPASGAPCAAATSWRWTSLFAAAHQHLAAAAYAAHALPFETFLLAMLLEEHKEVAPPARTGSRSWQPGAATMAEHNGWLLDLYADPGQGVALWLLGEDGSRLPPAPGLPGHLLRRRAAERLRELWRYLQAQPHPGEAGAARSAATCSPLSRSPCWHPGAAGRRAAAALPAQLTRLPRPDLLRCRPAARAAPRGRVRHLPAGALPGPGGRGGAGPGAERAGHALGAGPRRRAAAHPAPWSRTSTPATPRPPACCVRCQQGCYRLSLDSRERPLLVNLRAILLRHDPDLLLTTWGDTWLLPTLLELSENAGTSRCRSTATRSARSPTSQRAHLFLLRADHLPRPAGAPLRALAHRRPQRHAVGRLRPGGRAGAGARHRACRCRPRRASRPAPASPPCRCSPPCARGCWCPGTSSRPRAPRPPWTCSHADQGGLVYQPLIGLHRDVAEIDFISMYPSIMVHFNISPETVGSRSARPPSWCPQLEA